MFDAITGAYTGIKSAAEIVQSLLALKTDAAVTTKAVELNRVIFDIQQQLFAGQAEQAALLSRIRELEEQIVRFEDWENEKQRYHLHELVPVTYVYRLKPGMEKGGPVHELCPHCYQQRVKSILQDNGFDKAWHVFICPHCKTVFRGKREPMPILSVPHGRRMF